MKRRAFRSQWSRRKAEPKPEPVEAAHVKALRLPRPGPGITVNVPLHLWIEYKEIYRLEPIGAKPDGTLLVRRIREGKPA